jgi:hypothetical protein
MIVYASRSTFDKGVKFTSDKPTPIVTVDNVTKKYNIVYSGTLICCLYGLEQLFPNVKLQPGESSKFEISETLTGYSIERTEK